MYRASPRLPLPAMRRAASRSLKKDLPNAGATTREETGQAGSLRLIDAQRPDAVRADAPLASLELGKAREQFASRAIHCSAQQGTKHSLRQRALEPSRLAIGYIAPVRLEKV